MLVNKRREESETNFLSQSSDESDSDEYDRDFPIPEDNPFGCCKTNLYFEQSDMPVLNTIFSTIDELFQLNWIYFKHCWMISKCLIIMMHINVFE